MQGADDVRMDARHIAERATVEGEPVARPVGVDPAGRETHALEHLADLFDGALPGEVPSGWNLPLRPATTGLLGPTAPLLAACGERTGEQLGEPAMLADEAVLGDRLEELAWPARAARRPLAAEDETGHLEYPEVGSRGGHVQTYRRRQFPGADRPVRGAQHVEQLATRADGERRVSLLGAGDNRG